MTTARLTAIKTLVGFDFAFQLSLDKDRIMALAELRFIERAEVVHLLGPAGKSHVATTPPIEAVKAAKSVYFSKLATSSPRSLRPYAKSSCVSVFAIYAARFGFDRHVQLDVEMVEQIRARHWPRWSSS
ncbi:ATP-binding protein [Mesorhizobium sp.]|uniref:ATP-binding protein n=1 Tax=Mesorhizobium sp. TaxID=1871066 RepID=UPI00257E8836|nr:ATP-binding protein [Mesorhizobium sp.]